MTKLFSIRHFTAGFLFILTGIILLFQNFHFFSLNLPTYFFSWKMLLIGMGLFHLLTNRIGKGFILLFIGLYFLLPEVLNVPMDYKSLLSPGIIIIMGLLLLRNKTGFYINKPKIKQEVINANFMDAKAIFGGGSGRVASYDFEGGRLFVLFGGLEVDLTECYLPKETAIIDVNVVCGGITLLIPKEWNIKNEVTPILGGLEDEGFGNYENYVDPGALILIRGKIIMGGLEIKRI